MVIRHIRNSNLLNRNVRYIFHTHFMSTSNLGPSESMGPKGGGF